MRSHRLQIDEIAQKNPGAVRYSSATGVRVPLGHQVKKKRFSSYQLKRFFLSDG